MRSALVLGGARSVWDDADTALKLFTPDLTIAVNDMIGAWRHHLDLAVTLHPEKLHVWLDDRRRKWLNDPETWAHKKAGPEGKVTAQIDRVTQDWAGSSGLFAVKIARQEYGCDRIILAGVPMQAEAAHYFDQNEWRDCSSFLKGWTRNLNLIAPYVRSMSGWTADLLGRPDSSWLNRAA